MRVIAGRVPSWNTPFFDGVDSPSQNLEVVIKLAAFGLDGWMTMENPRHIPTLDGLRGLAALAVVWFHFPQVGTSRVAAIVQSVSQKTLSGSFAVDIFFVLSGFLITRIIIREHAEGRFSLRTFFVKRALRVFPIYWLTLLLLACLQPVSRQWVAAASYISNYTIPFDTTPHLLGHTWSLAVEEQFYLIWPVLFLLLPVPAIKRIACPWGPAVAILAAAGTFLFVDASLAWGLVYRGLPYRMLSLLLGATFAFHEATIRRWPARLVGPAVLACYIATIVAAGGFKFTEWSGFRWLSVILSAGTSFFVVQFAVCANERTGLVQRILTSRLLCSAGLVSYGMYFYHHIILFTLFNPNGIDPREHTLSPPQAAIALALCIAVPCVSFVVIERPVLRLKSRLMTHSKNESARVEPEFLRRAG